MKIRHVSTRSWVIHTITGPVTVSSHEHEASALRSAAIDAVRSGYGHERPWRVDEQGRPTKALDTYAELLSPFSLREIVAHSSPVAKEQADRLEPLMVRVMELAGQLEDVPRGSVAAIIDPTVRFLVVRELKELLVRVAPLVDSTGELARQIEAVPNDPPRPQGQARP